MRNASRPEGQSSDLKVEKGDQEKKLRLRATKVRSLCGLANEK